MWSAFVETSFGEVTHGCESSWESATEVACDLGSGSSWELGEVEEHARSKVFIPFGGDVFEAALSDLQASGEIWV